MNMSAIAATLALLGAFFLAPGIILTLLGSTEGYVPQAVGGIVLLAGGIGCLYAAARYTEHRYLVIGIACLLTMLLVFAASLFLVNRLG